MRILFAAPDRDLVNCYRLLLAAPDRQVETAYDGAQVLELLGRGAWDLAVLSRDLPRIPCPRLVARCSSLSVPTVVLTARPSAGGLPKEALPTAWLPLPFSPRELEETIARVQKAAGPSVPAEPCPSAPESGLAPGNKPEPASDPAPTLGSALASDCTPAGAATPAAEPAVDPGPEGTEPTKAGDQA